MPGNADLTPSNGVSHVWLRFALIAMLELAYSVRIICGCTLLVALIVRCSSYAASGVDYPLLAASMHTLRLDDTYLESARTICSARDPFSSQAPRRVLPHYCYYFRW